MQSENLCNWRRERINSVLWCHTCHLDSRVAAWQHLHTAWSFLHLEVSFYGTTAPSGASILQLDKGKNIRPYWVLRYVISLALYVCVFSFPEERDQRKKKREKETRKKVLEAAERLLTKRERRKAGEDMETVSCKRKWCTSDWRLKSASKVLRGSKRMPRKRQKGWCDIWDFSNKPVHCGVLLSVCLLSTCQTIAIAALHLNLIWETCQNLKLLNYIQQLLQSYSNYFSKHNMKFYNQILPFSQLLTSINMSSLWKPASQGPFATFISYHLYHV